MRSSIPLYNALAPEYEDGFYDAPHRMAYDLLAWEYVRQLLPAPPAVVVEAGCGTGHWVDRLLDCGHRVIGIEQAPEMVKALERKDYGPRFTLLAQDMEQVAIDAETADVVLAMGSVQYTQDPGRMVRRFAQWTRPGGAVCVLVDSFLALAVELLGTGKDEEALERLKTGRGVWKQHGQEADLHLLDSNTLESYFAGAGLTGVVCKGLLVTASALGLAECKTAIVSDQASVFRLERALSEHRVLADAGKQILVTGRRAAAT